MIACVRPLDYGTLRAPEFARNMMRSACHPGRWDSCQVPSTINVSPRGTVRRQTWTGTPTNWVRQVSIAA